MDARLRQLERLLRNGDPALLRERLRAGMVSPDDLWLAAHLGHPGARELLGEEAPPAREELRCWVDDLERRGLAERVAIAAAEAALPVYLSGKPTDARPAEALSAARAMRDARARRAPVPNELDPFARFIAALKAAEEVGAGPAHWAAMASHWAVGATLEPAEHDRFLWAAIDAAVRALGSESEVRAAIALALLPEGLRDLAA